MRFLWRCSFQILKLSRGQTFSQNPSSLLNLPILSAGSQSTKYFSGSTIRWDKDESPSTLSKYEKFSEETAPIILDVEEERQKVSTEEVVLDEFKGINLERSVNGVFDVTELVDLLKKEKTEDIFVVKIPPEYNYADYMVIVNGRSYRHMYAVTDFVRRVFKRKMGVNDILPKLEGKESRDWMALDLGNIVLHVFSREGREMYDLETLWTVGREYDSLSRSQSESQIYGNLSTDFAKILASLSPKT